MKKIVFLSLFSVFQASLFCMQEQQPAQNNVTNEKLEKLYVRYLITIRGKNSETSKMIGGEFNANTIKFFQSTDLQQQAYSEALRQAFPNNEKNNITHKDTFYSRHPFKFTTEYSSGLYPSKSYISENYLPFTFTPDIEKAFINRKQDTDNPFEKLMNKVAEVQDPWGNLPWYKQLFHHIFSDSKADQHFPHAKTKFKNKNGEDLNAGIHTRIRSKLVNSRQARLVSPIITGALYDKIIEDTKNDLIAANNKRNSLIP